MAIIKGLKERDRCEDEEKSVQCPAGAHRQLESDKSTRVHTALTLVWKSKRQPRVQAWRQRVARTGGRVHEWWARALRFISGTWFLVSQRIGSQENNSEVPISLRHVIASSSVPWHPIRLINTFYFINEVVYCKSPCSGWIRVATKLTSG